MNNCILYFHYNPVKQEIFYVGISNNTKRPFDITARSKWHKKIVKKYGYDVQIIRDDLTWEQACTLEIFWIKTIGRRNLKEGSLVNLTDGGEGSVRWKMSKTTKEKISKANKGNQVRLGKKCSDESKQRMSAAQKGSKASEETKAKMRTSRIGYKHSEETKQKIAEANRKRKGMKMKQKINLF